MTSLHLLNNISAGRTDLVLDFIESGNNANAVNSDGASLLQICAYYGDVSALRFLLSNGASIEQFGTDLGLNAAAFHGHWQLCQYLLELSAPVNHRLSNTGETALHAALCSEDRVRYDPVVSVLLAAGADPNASTIANRETGAFMRDCRTKGEGPLHRAAAFGTHETIQMLLKAGAKRELLDANGDSSLTWASWYRRPIDILRLLCYGPYSIHPEYRVLRVSLVGDPSVKNRP